MKKKVLFVCLGNICRSPMAKAVFDEKIDKKGLNIFYAADSCGTGGYHVGETADERTIACVRGNEIEINHTVRQLTALDLENFDLILAMDASNYEDIKRLSNSPSSDEKIKMMRSFAGEGLDVPDPYYGTASDFQEVFDILDKAMEGLIASLESARNMANGE